MYDRQYTRIDAVRGIVDDMLNHISDVEVKRCGFVHLYGVGQACALIALRRGFGRSGAELAEIAGMLHDWAKYKYNAEENHAQAGSEEVRPLLAGTGRFSEQEISDICHAIRVHSMKKEVHSAFDEILKDADEMQHCLRNPVEDYFFEKSRMQKLIDEFSLK